MQSLSPWVALTPVAARISDIVRERDILRVVVIVNGSSTS